MRSRTNEHEKVEKSKMKLIKQVAIEYLNWLSYIKK